MNTIRNQDPKVVGFTNRLSSYGLISDTFYKLELNLAMGASIPLYVGPKKPIFKNLNIIGILGLPLILLSYLIVPIVYVLYTLFSRYYRGAKNFYKNSAWARDVRFFNWVNLISLIICIILLLF